MLNGSIADERGFQSGSTYTPISLKAYNAREGWQMAGPLQIIAA